MFAVNKNSTMKKVSDIILQTTLIVLLVFTGLELILAVFGTMYSDVEWIKSVILFILKVLVLFTSVAMALYVFFVFIVDRFK